MNGYNGNTHGTRRHMPVMAMPNGQVIFWELDVEEQERRWSGPRDATRHPKTEDCREEQVKPGRSQANAKSTPHA